MAYSSEGLVLCTIVPHIVRNLKNNSADEHFQYLCVCFLVGGIRNDARKEQRSTIPHKIGRYSNCLTLLWLTFQVDDTRSALPKN